MSKKPYKNLTVQDEESTGSILEHAEGTGQTSSKKIYHSADSDKPLLMMHNSENNTTHSALNIKETGKRV